MKVRKMYLKKKKKKRNFRNKKKILSRGVVPTRFQFQVAEDRLYPRIVDKTLTKWVLFFPVVDLVDKLGVFSARLFRQDCASYRGHFIKDLRRLGRSLDRVIIIDNSPASYFLQPDNALRISSWFGDASDSEFLTLISLCEQLSKVDDVRDFLRASKAPFNSTPILKK